MHKIFSAVGISRVARLALAGAVFVGAHAHAAPFAMPPYYNVANDNKYPFYGDVNPTPEIAAQKSIDRYNAGSGLPALCLPYYQFSGVTPSGGGGAPYYDGNWAVLYTYRQYIANPPSCTPYTTTPSTYASAVRQWVVCDARLGYWGDPLSSSYSKYNYANPDNPCPDATPRPEKCPFCPVTGNPVNIPFGIKVQAETDVAPSYPGGVEFRRYYISYKYPNENIVPLRGLGAQWRHGYERGIKAVAYYNGAYVLRADTSVAYFYSTVNGYVSEADSADKLTKLLDGSGGHIGWQYYDARTESMESYDVNGKLTGITTRTGVAQTLTYDANGLLVQIEDSFGRTISFTYDATKRIATMTDPAGGVFAYGYDAYNNLATVTDPASRVRTYLYESTAFRNALTGIIDENSWRMSRYTYDSYGKVTESKQYAATGVEVNKYTLSFYNLQGGGYTTVTDPLGAARAYTFSNILGVQKPTSVTQPGTAPETKTFDVNGNTTSRTDNNGKKTCYAYDLTRNLETARVEGLPGSAVCATELAASTHTAPARKISTAWHATYRLPVSITEPTTSGSKVTSYTHDASGNVLARSIVVGGNTRTWTYSGYDAFGRVGTVDGPRSDVTDTVSYTYYTNNTGQGNNRGMINTVTNAAGHVTTVTSYNAFGQPLSVTDANGLVTSMTYDARQRLKTRNVGGETTSYDYDNVGQLIKVTMPDGSYLDYTYDGAHRLKQIADGLGNKVVYTLDNMGNRTKEDYKDPANVIARTRTREFDSLNRLKKDIGGISSSQTTQYGYDANGNQTSSTDPLSRVTSQTYDALNRLLNVIDPVNGASAPTKYEYDAQDNLTKVTDPKNLATTYVYNGFNELTSQTSPDTGTTGFTYDPAGNLLTKTDARSVTATYTYDNLNRVATISYPAYGSDAAETVTYTYDSCTNGVGRLCSLTDKTGTTTWSYDLKGRVTAKSQTISSLTQTVSYGYNAAGQLTSLTLPSGAVIGTGYSNNRIASLTLNPSGSNTPILTNADYEPFGPVGEWTWGNHTTGSPNKHIRYFDLDGRIGKIENATGLDARQYVIDLANRITGIETVTAGTSTVDTSKSFSYGYDNLDRLTSQTPGSGNSTPSQAYTYDAIGNRLTNTVGGGGGTTTYNYPSPVTSHRLMSLSGATAKTYTYDANGNRTGDGTTTWAYGGNNRPISATTGGTTTSFLINALGQRVSKTTSGTTTRFVYDEAGQLLGEYDGSGNLIQETVWLDSVPVATIRPNGSGGINLFYVHTDNLGTPRAITRPSDNALVWKNENVDPFGNAQPTENPGGAGTFKYNLRFPGQYADSETNTSYNYFRDYDAGIGRYIESDPIGLRGGINTYAYVDGSPLRYIDPLGLYWEYCTGTGEMFYVGENKRIFVGEGYAGRAGIARNNPDMQCKKNEGPLPENTYDIGKPVNVYQGGAMQLTPRDVRKMCNRDSFWIHKKIGSIGCIAVDDDLLVKIAESPDRELRVKKKCSPR